MTISVKHYSQQTDDRITEAYWCSNGLVMLTQHAADAKPDKFYGFEDQQTMWFEGYEIRTLLDSYNKGEEKLLDIDAVRSDWVPHRERIVSYRQEDGKVYIKALCLMPCCEEYFQPEFPTVLKYEGKEHPVPTSEIITTAEELAKALGACSGPLEKVFRSTIKE